MADERAGRYRFTGSVAGGLHQRLVTPMKILPELVAKLTHGHDAWIVGSAANPENKTPRDYDVQVPYSQWGQAAMLIPKDATRNSFGGWKCKSDGVEVDVWPGELGWIMQRPMCLWAWHPASGVRLNRCNEKAEL